MPSINNATHTGEFAGEGQNCLDSSPHSHLEENLRLSVGGIEQPQQPHLESLLVGFVSEVSLNHVNSNT